MSAKLQVNDLENRTVSAVGENATYLKVIVVFYNEEANVDFVTRGFLDAIENGGINHAQLILVDNGSTDDTWNKMARHTDPMIKRCRVTKNRGFGGGVLAGAEGTEEATHIAICDGDGQIDPTDLVALMEKTDWKAYALAKARRVNRPDGAARKLVSLVFNVLFRLLLRGDSEDYTGKPKVMTRTLWDRLELRSEDFFIDMEIVAKTTAMGEKIFELPTTYLPRHGGRSKVRFRDGPAVLWRCIGFRGELKRWKKRGLRGDE